MMVLCLTELSYEFFDCGTTLVGTKDMNNNFVNLSLYKWEKFGRCTKIVLSPFPLRLMELWSSVAFEL